MKSLIVFLSAFLLTRATCCFGQHNDNADKALYSKARVKTIQSVEHRYRKGNVKGRGKTFYTDTYDTLGRVISSDGETRNIYRYNEQGYVSREDAYVFKWDNVPLVTEFYYTYDTAWRVLTKKSSRQFGSAWKYDYDNAGRLIRSQWLLFGEDDFSNYFVDSFYYAGNQLVKTKRFHNGTALYFYLDYTYDSSGNLIRESRYENGRLTGSWVRSYDSGGHVTVCDFLGRNGKTESHTTYTYNEKGLLTGTYNTNYVDKRLRNCFILVYTYYP